MLETNTQEDITSLVCNYQDNHDEYSIKKLVKLFKTSLGDLVWSIIKYYGMLDFPTLTLEEIVEECENEVFLKCLSRFDRNKNAKFTTYYTWELKSSIRARKCQFLRKKHILLTSSIYDIKEKEEQKNSRNPIEQKFFRTKFDKKTIEICNRIIRDIFYGKSYFVKYPLGKIISI